MPGKIEMVDAAPWVGPFWRPSADSSGALVEGMKKIQDEYRDDFQELTSDDCYHLRCEVYGGF